MDPRRPSREERPAAVPPGPYWDEEDGVLPPADPGGGDDAPVTRMAGWRRRTASGAVLTGIALGLRDVFDPGRDEPLAVVQVGGEPPGPPGPVTVEIDPDDPTATRVRVRPDTGDGPVWNAG